MKRKNPARRQRSTGRSRVGAMGAAVTVVGGAGSALLLALGAAPAPATVSGTFTVDTLADGAANPSDCTTPVRGSCSLRDALAAAGVGDTVEFEASLFTAGAQTITLDAGQGQLQDPKVNIIGPGADRLTIDAAGNSRVLYLNSEATGTTISGLTITGGSAVYGAGIWDEEAGEAPNLLILDHVVVTGNSATSGPGGGVYAGSLHLVDSVISGNSTVAGGGGVYIKSAGGFDVGIERSTISDNSAAACGGGLYFGGTDSTLTVLDSTFSGNTADTSYGGGIDVDGNGNSVIIANSTFSGNSAQGGGGLNADTDNVVQIAMTTITGNTATTTDDPYYAAGGIHLRAGNTPGPPARVSSIAAPTQAPVSGASGSKHGDAHVQDVTHTSSLEMAGVILAGNHAPAGMPTDLGVGSNRLHPETTVQADSSMVGGLGVNVTLAGSGLLRGTDPQLGPLADNGGPTHTHLPLAGSPVLDAGPAVVPDFPDNAYDQRGPGYDRTSGLATDIGAVEVQIPKPAPEPEPTFTG